MTDRAYVSTYDRGGKKAGSEKCGGAKGWKNARKPSGVVGYKKRCHREISSDRLASHYLQHV